MKVTLSHPDHGVLSVQPRPAGFIQRLRARLAGTPPPYETARFEFRPLGTAGPWEVFDLTVIGSPGPSPGPDPAHVPPGPLTEPRAQQVFEATVAEFPRLLGPYATDTDGVAASLELVRRTIWHLHLAGYDAARQRNPSGAMSNDKLTVRVGGRWAWVDLGAIGGAGRPFVPAWQYHDDDAAANPVPDAGVAD